MNVPDPLVSLSARVLNLSVNTPTQIVIDRLLRLQNAKGWREPITVYISPSEDNRSISVQDFLQIHAVLRALRSPIYTVALGGMLRGCEVLLLASGERGHRQVLEHTFVCLEPFCFDTLSLNDCPISMGPPRGESLREQAERLIRAELDRVLKDLRLDPSLFQKPLIVGAQQGIAWGILDAVVPIVAPAHAPTQRPECEAKVTSTELIP